VPDIGSATSANELSNIMIDSLALLLNFLLFPSGIKFYPLMERP